MNVEAAIYKNDKWLIIKRSEKERVIIRKIEEAYRKNGLGKKLIAHMIEIAIGEQKTPVLATSVSNIAAMRTYESIGFEMQGEYAFEFLD